MTSTHYRDPIQASLSGDEHLEWRGSPNWELAEFPRCKRVFRFLLLLTILSSLGSILLVIGSPALRDGATDRPFAVALMVIAFWITGYIWLRLTRKYFEILVHSDNSRQICYALTNKKLIVIPDYSKRLLVNKADYRLSNISLHPNGLVHDMELTFEHKELLDSMDPVGTIILRALDNAETIKAAIIEQFSSEVWTCQTAQ
nr:hypothetical protein [uncultured Cohaesibacter sp.]